MIDIELKLLEANPEWRIVLEAYRDRQANAREEAKAADQDFDGWVERLNVVDELDEEHLPRIHGKLIAMGFLKFELTGPTTGVVYQVTPVGTQALEKDPLRMRSREAEVDDNAPMEQSA